MIRLRDISVDRKEFHLSISELDFDSGVCVLLGANGSGKSTLLRVILGLEKGGPSAHRSMLGLPVDHSRSWRTLAGQVGYLAQRHTMPSRWTVLDYLSYAGWLKGMSRDAAEAAAADRAGEFHIENLISERIRRLSGGQARRVGTVQAVIASPKILLLDEPAAELDSTSRHLLMLNIDKYAAEGNCVLIVDHGALEIQSTWRSVRLEDGRLVEQ